MGKIRTPFFRIVVTDSRKARNGLSIEEIGRYVPGQEPSIMEVNSDRAQYWLGVGAQPTAAVEAIFKVTGDWQKFKGLPGTEGTLRFATPKPAKSIAYEAAVKAANDEPKEGATTMKKKAQEKLAAKANPAPVVEEVIVDEVAVEAVVETPVVSEPTATDVVAVSEPTTTDVVAEVPAEPVTTDAVVETLETPTEAAAE
mgnify:CR=1 FL=1